MKHTARPPRAGPLALSLRRTQRQRARRLGAGDISELLDRTDVLILDTETTGVGPGAKVIEVVAVDTTSALRVSELALLVGRVSIDSWQVHGLTEDALHALGAGAWPDVHETLAAALRKAERVVAWSADFDARVLAQTVPIYNLSLPDARWADVRPAYREARPEDRHRLADAMQCEGLAWTGRQHRAEPDCRAVLAVMPRIAEEAR